MKSQATFETKIGQYHIDVEGSNISIVGEWGSNFGQFYLHNIDRFLTHPKNPENDWSRPQIIGMEWDYGLVPAVTNWLYTLVYNQQIKAN